MAVRNAYVLSEVIKTQVNGGQVIAIAGNFETLVADDILSKYRLCKVGADWIPLQIQINNDAIAGFTDANLGLYDTLENGGAAKDYDVFMDGTDINAGSAMGSEVSGLSNIDIDSIGEQMYQYASDSAPTPDGMYDLVLTADSEITGAGTVAVRMLFAKAA
jgi:hypothetical protein